jgi:hypothetical protein
MILRVRGQSLADGSSMMKGRRTVREESAPKNRERRVARSTIDQPPLARIVSIMRLVSVGSRA